MNTYPGGPFSFGGQRLKGRGTMSPPALSSMTSRALRRKKREFLTIE
jgi:hypothetical protein